MSFLISLADRIYDHLHNTETARAWDNRGRCIGILRLPKGYSAAIGALAELTGDPENELTCPICGEPVSDCDYFQSLED